MKLRRCITLAAALGLGSTPFAAISQQPPAMGHAPELVGKTLHAATQAGLVVTSPAFQQGGDIPYENTQYRGNIFPGLSWTRGPAETRSYAVIVQGESLSRTHPSASIHLTLFNVPPTVTTLKPGMSTPPAGATYGPNVHGLDQAYAGPHTHTAAKNGYHYQVFALDTVLKVPDHAEFEAVVDAMKDHVLATGDLMGMSAKDPEAKEEDPGAAHSVPR